MDKEKQYFKKQKFIGALMLVISVILANALGDVTFCFVAIPVALYLLFSNERLWIDDYYYECEELDEID